MFAYLDISWAIPIVGTGVYGATDGYVLSYGQVLAIFTAIPPLITTVNFIHSCDLLDLIQCFPRECRNEVVYLITGKLLDPPTKGNLIPLNNPTPAPTLPSRF